MWYKSHDEKEKGFSLVELIVVIAIMGVLMVVLAPQYLRYVEKTRLQKDNAAIGEIAESIKAACSEEAIAQWVSDQPRPLKLYMQNAPGEGKKLVLTTGTGRLLEDELDKMLGKEFATSSLTYRDSTTDIVFSIDQEAGAYLVKVHGIILSPGEGTTSKQL